MDFVAPRYAHVSPLAKKLFAIDGVNRVFYGKDHIAVSKKEELEWEVTLAAQYSHQFEPTKDSQTSNLQRYIRIFHKSTAIVHGRTSS